jgi:hypothetical protein
MRSLAERPLEEPLQEVLVLARPLLAVPAVEPLLPSGVLDLLLLLLEEPALPGWLRCRPS